MKNIVKKNILYLATFPPPEGGQTIIFKQLYDDLNKRYSAEFRIHKIDLSVKQYGALTFFVLLLRLLKAAVFIPFVKGVVFQAPYTYVHSIGIYVAVLCKITRRPLILRRSAGNGIVVYKNTGKLTKWILQKTVLNADLAFYETHYQVDFFKRISHNAVFFMSNCRPSDVDVICKTVQRVKNFVYIGQVIKEKGIPLLLDAFETLGDELDVELNIYGNNQNKFKSISEHITFHGAVPNSQISNILKQNDVLLLPSNYQGEGYPGVIIEAFLMNKPVIATSLDGISELVKHGFIGLLVKPENSKQLMDAIRLMVSDVKLYNDMSRNIYENKRYYTTEYWTDYFVEKIKEVVR